MQAATVGWRQETDATSAHAQEARKTKKKKSPSCDLLGEWGRLGASRKELTLGARLKVD